MGSTNFDVKAIRAQFPALDQKQVFMDNAGGSQVLESVINSISEYFSRNNVQLGASYPISQVSTNKFNDGHIAGAKYINASPNEVVFGPATTQLFRNLSVALKVEPGAEIVLSNLDHEANLAPWVQLAEWKGLTVKWWIPSKKHEIQSEARGRGLEEIALGEDEVGLLYAYIKHSRYDYRYCFAVESHPRNKSECLVLR